MHERLMTFLRCPECGGRLRLARLDDRPPDDEVLRGLLGCEAAGHTFPVVRGLPRMLPDAMAEHWCELESALRASDPALAQRLAAAMRPAPQAGGAQSGEERTRASFSAEWSHHAVGARTWGMEVDDRVDVFFLGSVRVAPDALHGTVVLDAGCGDGSQSVAYTALGMEVIAVDLSDGLERGPAYRERHPRGRRDRVHFVQGDLRRPPVAPGTVDVIHAVGVLHHTPDALQTFRALRPLLRDGGTFYVWLYHRERYMTAVIDALRAVTTRLPAPAFARVVRAMAGPFLAFRAAATRLGIRGYPPATRTEAAFALFDTFGSPHRSCHSFDEVAAWYRAEGFESIWKCNEGRRGFGACGRLPAAHADPVAEAAAVGPNGAAAKNLLRARPTFSAARGSNNQGVWAADRGSQTW